MPDETAKGMKEKVLIDTNVIIDILQPKPGKSFDIEPEETELEVDDLYNLLENHRCMLSILSLMEVYKGGSSDRSQYSHFKERIESFKKRGLRILPVNKKHSLYALKLFEQYFHAYPPSKKGSTIIVDRIIAAQSIIERAKLWTNNVKDFHYINGIDLYEPFYRNI